MGVFFVLLLEIFLGRELKDVILMALSQLVYLFLGGRNFVVKLITELNRLLRFNFQLVHLFESKCLVLSDSYEFLFNFKIVISELVQHFAFGVRYEISLILKSL